jgi:hypothetical protein
MMTGYGNVEDAVQAMKEGAFHYLTKPVVLAELKLMLDKALATERMERTLSFYQEREAQKSGLQALIGESPVMLELKHTLRQVLDAERRMASDDLPPVLVEGETGTGKELVARPAFRRQRARGRSSSSTARRSRPTCWRPNCSATRRAPSPMPRSAGWAWSRRPMAAPCSSTRSARWTWCCRPSCSSCWKIAAFAALAR